MTMPEGDTLHYAANRIRPILLGKVADEITMPHRRFAMHDWPQRLAGREVVCVDAHGKHLFIRWEGDLAIHSHLRMTGSWGTYDQGQRWRRSPYRAWLVIRAGDRVVVQFDGPVLDLMTESRTRFDRRITALGPDIIKECFDEARYLKRLREDDPTRPIGDALLDQRTLAGIGNLWKVETCFAVGIDPWRPTAQVSDDEALALVRWARPGMQRSARDGNQTRFKKIYGKTHLPCPRCGGKIKQRGQWDDNRPTYWCPSCQH